MNKKENKNPKKKDWLKIGLIVDRAIRWAIKVIEYIYY